MSTIIRVRPEQVPQVWDAIKLAAVKSQEVAESALPQVCLRLLHGLLSDTVQCFVTLDEQRTILQVCLTQVQTDRMTGLRELVLTGLYSFKLMQDDDKQAFMLLIRGVAQSQQCSQIVCGSRNPRLWTMYEQLGFREASRHYVYLMEGNNGQQQ